MFTVIKQDSPLLFKTGEGKRRNALDNGMDFAMT